MVWAQSDHRSTPRTATNEHRGHGAEGSGGLLAATPVETGDRVEQPGPGPGKPGSYDGSASLLVAL